MLSYRVPDHVALSQPVERPEPGTLPVRPDLAHIALANKYLAAHYVKPITRFVGPDGAVVRLAPMQESAKSFDLPAGRNVELLELQGDWAWVCEGPDGRSGYVTVNALEPIEPPGR